MLGRYNAQGLGDTVENLTREFVVSDGTYIFFFPAVSSGRLGDLPTGYAC